MKQVHAVVSMDHVIKGREKKKLIHFLFFSVPDWSRDLTVPLDLLSFEMISSRNTFAVIPFRGEVGGGVRGWMAFSSSNLIRLENVKSQIQTLLWGAVEEAHSQKQLDGVNLGL